MIFGETRNKPDSVKIFTAKNGRKMMKAECVECGNLDYEEELAQNTLLHINHGSLLCGGPAQNSECAGVKAG